MASLLRATSKVKVLSKGLEYTLDALKAKTINFLFLSLKLLIFLLDVSWACN